MRFCFRQDRRTMQNILRSSLHPSTYRCMPMSRCGQTLPSCPAARRSSYHKTCLPFWHRSFRYPSDIPYPLLPDDKCALLPVRKRKYPRFPAVSCQFLPAFFLLPKISFDSFLFQMLSFHFSCSLFIYARPALFFSFLLFLQKERLHSLPYHILLPFPNAPA